MLTVLYAASYFVNRNKKVGVPENPRSCITSSSLSESWIERLRNFVRLLIMSVEDKFRAAVKVIQSLPADGNFLIIVLIVFCRGKCRVMVESESGQSENVSVLYCECYGFIFDRIVSS